MHFTIWISMFAIKFIVKNKYNYNGGLIVEIMHSDQLQKCLSS